MNACCVVLKSLTLRGLWEDALTGRHGCRRIGLPYIICKPGADICGYTRRGDLVLTWLGLGISWGHDFSYVKCREGNNYEKSTRAPGNFNYLISGGKDVGGSAACQG